MGVVWLEDDVAARGHTIFLLRGKTLERPGLRASSPAPSLLSPFGVPKRNFGTARFEGSAMIKQRPPTVGIITVQRLWRVSGDCGPHGFPCKSEKSPYNTSSEAGKGPIGKPPPNSTVKPFGLPAGSRKSRGTFGGLHMDFGNDQPPNQPVNNVPCQPCSQNPIGGLS
jgi:hypothetical protein